MSLQFKPMPLMSRFCILLSHVVQLFPCLKATIAIVLMHIFLIVVGLQFSGVAAVDFKVYYEAAVWWNYGSNPWQLKLAQFQADSYDLPFLYPPPFFIFFTPFISLDVTSAFITWTCLMESLMIPTYIILALSVRDAGIELTERNKSIIFATLLLSGPTMEGLVVGQVQMITLFAVLLYWYSISHKWPGFAGVCLAIACLIKPFLAVAILCAIWFREWRVVHYFFLTIFLVFFLSLCGGVTIRSYVDYLTRIQL